MLVLLGFAFLAGLVTFLSPCVLPVLPIILATSVQKSRTQPVAMIVGLIFSFCFFTLFLAAIVRLTHLPANVLRYVSIAIVFAFGLTLLIPAADRLLSRILSPVQNLGARLDTLSRSVRSEVLSGLVLGCALGLLWTPCAGPILATVISLVATQQINSQAVAILFAYALGSGLPMLGIAFFGQRLLKSSRWLNRHLETIRRTFGVLMILTSILLATELDAKFLQVALKVIPPIAVDSSPMVQSKIAVVKGQKALPSPLPSNQIEDTSGLPRISGAPELTGIKGWINSAPLTIASLRGKVVLVDFWTYSCINCIRTLPYLTRWYDTYKNDGLVIIGVHTPEFEFEKDEANVKRATERFGIHYPVALDNDYATWNAYNNQYWPAHYLIDQTGIVREAHFGEGDYAETEKNILALLKKPAVAVKQPAPETPQRVMTPETYLGHLRAEHYVKGLNVAKDVTKLYTGTLKPEADQVSLAGEFLVGDERLTAKKDGASLILNFEAAKVYLVMSGPSNEPVKVILDDKPLAPKYFTSDMNPKGEIIVNDARKYDIVDLKGEFGRHVVRIEMPAGVSAYAFTFGDQ